MSNVFHVSVLPPGGTTAATVTIDAPFPNKFMSATSYYIFQSFSMATFPDWLCLNDSIAKLRVRRARKYMGLILKAKKDAEETRKFQKESIVTDKWGPPCKVKDLGDSWNVETLSAPQRRLQSNCLNYVNALVMSSKEGALIDHSKTIMQARMLAVCMSMHPRCGRDSMIYHILHGQPKLFRKIVALAEKTERRPRWLLDGSVSEAISEAMRLPIAVCAAEMTAEKAQAREQKRREKFFEDRKRLFLLASKAAGADPDWSLSINAPSKASFVPNASRKSEKAGIGSLCSMSTRALQGFTHESSITESKRKMKEASASFRRAPAAPAHAVYGIQTPLHSCTESSRSGSHNHTPVVSSRALSDSGPSPTETSFSQTAAASATSPEAAPQVIL